MQLPGAVVADICTHNQYFSIRGASFRDSQPLDDPFYYLNNFQRVLSWLEQRYADVLSPEEQLFIGEFAALPRASQGLLVRMVMRKGLRFRHSKLSYPEIGDIGSAVEPLLALGWVEEQAPLSLVELFEVLLKSEILVCLGHLIEQPKAKNRMAPGLE